MDLDRAAETPEFSPEAAPTEKGSPSPRMAPTSFEGALNLKNHTLEGLYERMLKEGFTMEEVRRIMARAIAYNSDRFDDMAGISRVKQNFLRDQCVTPRLTQVECVHSDFDHFTRYLFRTHDGHLVEAVRIPLNHQNYSICISSQVGCALGCVFCATGKLGFTRNLEAWEMVDQVLQIKAGADRPVTGVVFMGQGEPFLNYENVITAATIMRSPTGVAIKAENITISTAGILPMIERYTAEKHVFRLIVSISAGSTDTRRQIMPIEKKYPLEQLVPAIAAYAEARRTRATIAYVALAGINTSTDELLALKKAFEGVPIRFNLIEVNDPSGLYRAPVGPEFTRFVDDLQKLESPIVRRYTGGKDVNAACGMLASTHTDG